MSRRWTRLLLAVACLLPGAAALPASAEPVMSVFPNTRWTGEVGRFEVVLQGADTGRDLELVLTPREGLPGDPFRAPLVPQGPEGTRFTAAVLLSSDPGGAVPDGTTPDPAGSTPAAPGLYDASVTADGDVVESCSACVTLVTRTAPTVAGPAAVSVRRVEVGRDVELTMTGRSFADGTVVEALLGGKPDRGVALTGASTFAHGTDTGTRLTRAVSAAVTPQLGLRDLRITNTDGRTSTCRGCLTLTSPAASVEPVGATNSESQRRVVLRSSGILPRTARPTLFWVGPGAPDPTRDLLAKTVLAPTGTGSLEAVFDLTGAAPGDHAYRAGFTMSDGSKHDCEGQCRFTVRQVEPPAITGLSAVVQQPGTTKAVTVTGTGFSRGTQVEVDGGVLVRTAYRSPTTVVATVHVPRTADTGPRTVSVSSTDDRGATWDGTFTVAGEPVGNGSAPVPATSDPELDPEPDLAPAAPSLRLSTATSVAQQRVLVSGTAEPGSTLDLLAYTRPSTSYKLVKSLNVPQDGRWSAVLAPSAGTRLYAQSRNPFGRSASRSVALQVRPALALTATRTGPRSARFAVRSVPARKGLRVSVTAAVGGRQVPLGAVVLDAQGRGVLDRRGLLPALTVTARTGKDLVHAAGTSAPVRLR